MGVPVQGLMPSIPVLFTLGGVVASFISTFFAYGYTRWATAWSKGQP